MKKLKNFIYKKIIRKRVFKKVLYVTKMLFALLINCIFLKFRKKYAKCWLLGSGDDRYENNIRVFDQYLRFTIGADKVIWVVDRLHMHEDVWKQKTIIRRGSIKNYIIALNCYCCAFTHNDWDISPGLFRIKKHHKAVLLYLEHAPSGIKKEPSDTHSKIPADIQCCLSNYERTLKLKEGAKTNAATVTGFAGYDSYEVIKKRNAIKEVLIMPTWRPWDLNGDRDFSKTELFKAYDSVFKNQKLKKIVINNNINITFILHPTAARYYDLKTSDVFQDRVFNVDVITGNDGRMRNKIINSDLLITDYSTLCIDFMYMNKPVLLYWFDYSVYYEKNGLVVNEDDFGRAVSFDENIFVDKLLKILDNPNYIEQPPLSYEYFDYYDHDNCKRIFTAVSEFVEKKKQ